MTHRLVLTDGQGRVNYEIARHLSSYGHAITLVATEVDPALVALPQIEVRKVAVPRHVPSALLKQQVFAVGAWIALRKDIRSFDIVQLNGAITFVAADVNIANFVHSDWAKSPYHSGRVHRSVYGMYQKIYTAFNAIWERKAFHVATCVVAVSAHVARSLVNAVGLDQGRIVTIEPGVDPTEFHPLRKGEANLLRENLGLPVDAFILFFAGDLRTNRKNFDLILSTMKFLDRGVHLVVAGSIKGSPFPSRAEKLDLTNRVHFLGHRSDVADLLRGADVFVFPSHYDPFGLVVTEAMASGVTTVTARNVGAASMIVDGETGFVLPDSNDGNGLLEILKRLRADPALNSGIAASGRKAAAGYSWESMARRYADLYEEIAETKSKHVGDSISSLSDAQPSRDLQ